MDMLADDAAALIKALGLKRVHLCGLSVGGMLGQKLAAKAPELLASLILTDTASQMSQTVWDERIAAIRKADSIAGTVDATMERWFTKPFRDRDPAAIAGIRNMYGRTPVAGYLGCAVAIRNMDLRPDDADDRLPDLDPCRRAGSGDHGRRGAQAQHRDQGLEADDHSAKPRISA